MSRTKTYESAQNTIPEAFITTNRNRRKIYHKKNGNFIYLENGTTYEIELYNPKNVNLLTKIKLDGKYISQGGIILRPGERIFLKRFLDTNREFIFNTYNIKNTNRNKQAIHNNGQVIIEYYEEEIINIPFVPYIEHHIYHPTIIEKHHYPKITWTCNSSGNWYQNSGSVLSNNLYNANSVCNSNTYYNSTNESKNIETGQTEQGNTTDQVLVESTGNFKTYMCKHYEYKLLPISQKQYQTNEIRYYCTKCGAKQKKTNKFCPNCGNKL